MSKKTEAGSSQPPLKEEEVVSYLNLIEEDWSDNWRRPQDYSMPWAIS